ncbi:site-specific integrase [Paraburkholderia sp. LEh10]|nr:site-specific integrase [Paraburkholderia sp. LEh10]
MKYAIHDQVTLSRAPEGPLADHLISFANAISAQGYSAKSMKQQVRIAACFSRWLKQTGVSVQDICFDHARRYLRYRARHVRPYLGDRAALRHLIDFMRSEGVIPVEKTATRRVPPVEICAQAYAEYLRDAQALAVATVINYVPFVRDFLRYCFGDGKVTLSRLRAADVVGFVQLNAPRLHLRLAKLMTTALRFFCATCAIAATLRSTWRLPFQSSPTGRCRQFLARFLLTRRASCWLASIDELQSVVATTPSCFSWRDWDCALVRSPFLSLMISTGARAR